MNIKFYFLSLLSLSFGTIAYAENMNQSISQEAKHFYIKLHPGDVVSVKFDLKRYPIFRQHEWYSYVLSCKTYNRSKISYPLKGEEKIGYSSIMLSYDDGQLICSKTNNQWCVDSETNEYGVLTVENISDMDNSLTCDLYNKIGI